MSASTEAVHTLDDPSGTEEALLRVDTGADLMMRWGGGTVFVLGVLGTVLGHFLPGVVHAALAGTAMLALFVHLLVAGLLLTRPAMKPLRTMKRRLVVRWCARMANLLVLGMTYPVLAVPWVGAVVPVLGCVGMLAAHRAYLRVQLRRDASGTPLHPLETVLLVGLAGVVLAVVVVALVAAVTLGLAVQWAMDTFGA